MRRVQRDSQIVVLFLIVREIPRPAGGDTLGLFGQFSIKTPKLEFDPNVDNQWGLHNAPIRKDIKESRFEY